MKKLLFCICIMVMSYLFSATCYADSDGVIYAATGQGVALAIKDDNSLWAWGRNDVGQLGGGKKGSIVLEPQKILDNVKQAVASTEYTALIKMDGTLWLAGALNGYSEFDGVDGLVPLDFTKVLDNARQVSCSALDMAVVTNDGNLLYYEIYLKNPIKLADDVVCAETFTDRVCFIKTDNSLWQYGRRLVGQPYVEMDSQPKAPKKIMENVKSVYGGWDYMLILKSDGSLWTYGGNEYGQLGNGTLHDNYSPQKIMDNIKSISKGNGYYTCYAIDNEDILWGWGLNENHMLGTSESTEPVLLRQPTPVKIMDGVKMVSVSDETLALKVDGSLWSWGSILNDDESISFVSPHQIIPGNSAITIKESKYMFGESYKKEPTEDLDNNNALEHENEIKKYSNIRDDNINLYINNEKIQLDVPVKNVDGALMYPFRNCLEAMGASVRWDDKNKTASGVLDGKLIVFELNSSKYLSFGTYKQMDSDIIPILIEGKTYIPIRYAAEGLGFSVEWDERNRTVNISPDSIEADVNRSNYAKIYTDVINSYLGYDVGLNYPMKYLAIDMKTMKGASDEDKKRVAAYFNRRLNVEIKDASTTDLKEQGLMGDMNYIEGLAIGFTNKSKFEENEITLEGYKFRSGIGANGFASKFERKDGKWKLLETRMTWIS